MITIENLSKQYGRINAVSALNLSIDEGEVFGFIGLNGAGKTTVIRMLTGLLRPSDGSAYIGGVRVRGPLDAPRLAPLIGLVSQDVRFHERATLLAMLRLHSVLTGSSIETGIEFARRAGVPLDRQCRRLSPGQQRKAQLAIALMKAPRYLFLDEPSAGLDPIGVCELREVIRRYRESGGTVFLSSHLLGEIESLCSSIGILHQGQLRYLGRPPKQPEIRLEDFFHDIVRGTEDRKEVPSNV